MVCYIVPLFYFCLILKFYTGSRETLCCACWKWPDWRRGIPSNHQDSCSSRGKSPPNKSGIFTVCPIAVYPAAVWFLGSFNHRHRPQRPDLLQRRSNTAGTCVLISLFPFISSALDKVVTVQSILPIDTFIFGYEITQLATTRCLSK